MNTTVETVKTFWDLTPDDVFDICLVKIKHINWKPEIEDVSYYPDQTQGLVKCVLGSVASNTSIKLDDDRFDITSTNSGVAKGYSWAMLNTNRSGTFVEYRVYFANNNRIQFCNKLDPIDELVNKLVNLVNND